MSRHQHRRRVSSTILALQPLEPRSLMAADAGFSAGLAGGPRLTLAQAQPEDAGSHAVEQAHIRRDVGPAAVVIHPSRQAVAVEAGMFREAIPGGMTTPRIAPETFGIAAPRGFGAGLMTDPGAVLAGPKSDPASTARSVGKAPTANAETNANISSSLEVPGCNRRKYDHIGNFNLTQFGADHSETANI